MDYIYEGGIETLHGTEEDFADFPYVPDVLLVWDRFLNEDTERTPEKGKLEEIVIPSPS